MLIKRMHQKNVLFVTIGTLKVLVLSINHIFAVAVSFNNVAIVYVNWNAYRIHFWYMSKYDAISIFDNSNFLIKKGVL